MSEVVLGDIVAKLRIDSTQFESALNAATQRLQQFQQATSQATQQQSAEQRATQQLAQAIAQLTQALQQQTQAFSTARTTAQTFQQTLNQTNSTVHQTQQTFNQTSSTVNQFNQTFNQTTTVLRQASTAAQEASSGFRAMVQVAGGIGIATGIGALVGQIKEFAVSTVDVATRMQSLQASLSALGGSALAGAQQFAQLYQMAQGLGVAFEPLARGFRQLTAAATQAGLPLTEQQRLLQALATEGRRVGASNEELGRAITALAQVASKGKVSMEELRQQLGEAIPTALAATAKGMGVTTAELEKMVETGTLEFVPFAKALRRGFEEMQQASGEFASGARQAFNQLGNAFLAFKDAVGANVLPELERLAKVATGILDTARALLNLAGGRRDPVLGPNTASEVQGTPEQERRIESLRNTITRLEQQAAAAVPGPLKEQREGMLQRAREELDTLIQVVQATKDQTAADRDANAERNKSGSVLERQAAFNERLQKAIEGVRKEEAAFREQARYAPNVLGDPQGTAEQQATFARARQQALEKSVTQLTETVNTRGAGVTVTEEQAKAIRALDVESKKYGDTIDALKEKEQARAKAEREALAQAERAVGQRIQIEQALTEAKAFGAREDQSAALAARARVEAEGAALRTRLEQQLEATRKNPQIGGDYAQRLRDQLAALPGQVEAQAAQAYTDALNKQIEPLQRLAGLYGDSAEGASELAKAQDLVFKLIGTPLEEKAFGYLDYLEKLIQLQREAAESAPAGMRARETANRTITFDQNVEDQLERLRLPREERLADRLRDQARKQGVDVTPEREARLQAITEQERWNQLMDVTLRLGDQVSQSLTQGLLSIVDGTERVGQAFRAMAKSILDSLSQIAVSEGFRWLIRLGLGAITSGAGASYSNVGASAGGGGTGFEILMAQSGAVVNRPTHLLVGENPAMNPETVLNKPQLTSLINSARNAGPTAGGQAAGGGISIINVGSRAQAEQEAARERAMGRQVIINEVLNDLAAGDGSRIGRAIKVGQR